MIKELIDLKKRIFAAVLLWLLLSAMALPICYNLDRVLSGNPGALEFRPKVVFPAVWNNPLLLRMWLLVVALCGLFTLLAMAGSAYLKYNNKLYTVVPGVQIPLPAGRGEHGTAWWMPKAAMGKAWTQVSVDPKAMVDLLAAGTADQVEIQRLRAEGKLDAGRGRDGRG